MKTYVMAFTRVLRTIALCFSKKVTPSAIISWNFWKWDKDKPHKKNIQWIPILVAACIISKNILVYRCFSSGLRGKTKFETHCHGLFSLVKKAQPMDMLWKLSLSLIVLCFFLRENFQAKSLCSNNIVARFYVYSL